MSPWVSKTTPDPNPVDVEISTTDGCTLFTTDTRACWNADPGVVAVPGATVVAVVAAVGVFAAPPENAATANVGITARSPNRRTILPPLFASTTESRSRSPKTMSFNDDGDVPDLL